MSIVDTLASFLPKPFQWQCFLTDSVVPCKVLVTFFFGCLQQSVVSERVQPVDFGRNETLAPQVRPRISLLTSMPSTPDYISGIASHRNRIQQWVSRLYHFSVKMGFIFQNDNNGIVDVVATTIFRERSSLYNN